MEESIRERESWLKENGFVMSRNMGDDGTVSFQDFGDSGAVYYENCGVRASIRFVFVEDKFGTYKDAVAASGAEDAVKIAGKLIESELWKMSDLLHGWDDGNGFVQVDSRMWNYDHTRELTTSRMVKNFGPFSVSYDKDMSTFCNAFSAVSNSDTVHVHVIAVKDGGVAGASDAMLRKVSSAIESVKRAFRF